MKTSKRWLAVLGVAAVAGVSFAAGKAAKEVTIKVEDAKFNPMMKEYPDGPAVALLWGDMNSAHGELLRLPPDGNSGWHTHSNDYRGVLVKGTMENQSQDEKTPVKVTPGSFWFTPGKSVHLNHCLPGSECLIYIQFDKKQDFVPAQEPK